MSAEKKNTEEESSFDAFSVIVDPGKEKKLLSKAEIEAEIKE